MDDISVRDLKMMYKDSVILWKGAPALVKNVSEDYRFTLWDLGEQRLRYVKWIAENFAAPAIRIGYINLGTNCIYAHRIPIRRYKVGLASENTVRIPQDHRLNAYEDEIASNTIAYLNSVNLFNALVNNYPNLEDAYAEAKEVNGVVAFDKQFAVSHNDSVYYKGKFVGRYIDGMVRFDGEHSHLTRALLSK